MAQLRQPAAWVSLDEGDNDPIRFWSYLIAACQSVQGGVGESALGLFQAPQPIPDDAIPTILSTRVDPPWPLARLRARNQLVEVRAQDLRFTTEEAAAFLNQGMGLNLSPEDVAALEARTEGWVAGLQLAAISMKGRSDLAGFVKALTGSHVYIAEYLVEEVLQRQPEELKRSLCR